MCKCKCCNKEFEYGDSESPMYTDEVWRKLLNHYKLEKYEVDASNRFYKAYSKWDKSRPFPDREDYHCYVCHECASKVLERKLNKSDIIDCTFNIPFMEKYLTVEKT